MTLPGKVIGGYSALDRRHGCRPVAACHAAHKFGGYAIFFVYTALLGLPALVLAVIVRRRFEKETPPSRAEGGAVVNRLRGVNRAGGTCPFRSGAWGARPERASSV